MPARAHSILRSRFDRRDPDLLAMVREGIFARPASPYLRLFRMAGCEYGDVERLVGQYGIEGALRALYRQGIYLTVEEFKGRQPVVRGSASLAVRPELLRPASVKGYLANQSGGSRGRRVSTPMDLPNIWESAVDRCLALEARGGHGWRHAIWGVPGGTTISKVLRFAMFGQYMARWFSQVDAATPGLHPRYRWSERALRWTAHAAGARLPRPEIVPPDAPMPIVRWMAATLRQGDTPHVDTSPSSAVRLCQAAMAAGVDLRGVQLTMGSEATTAARLAVIRQSGATALPSYGSSEFGGVTTGCLAPAAPDDVHLFHDLVAVVQPGLEGGPGGLPPLALLVTSFSRAARLVLVNLSVGDQAEMGERACSCPLSALGWRTHLSSIRSFEKLTAGGMTFLDRDIVRVLEEVLPARFGGGPTDYQVVEDETERGEALLRLLVHPDVGPLDHATVREVFLQSVGGGDGTKRLMELQWRGSTIIRVEREAPRRTAAGKILHLHVSRARRPLSPT
ncbi:MAG: hypothetical protein IT307_02875 [Chloroflexi bacterium]|nr:hypothetical protein [Chloroflexota bacterium]